MNLARVRENVLRMMRKFPSRTVTISRRTADAYGQPTDTETELGTFTCWSEGANRPTKWDVTDGGTRYESEGARWICLIWTEELPQARAGDIVRFADGETGVIKNTANDANIRVFWQIGERGRTGE